MNWPLLADLTAPTEYLGPPHPNFPLSSIGPQPAYPNNSSSGTSVSQGNTANSSAAPSENPFVSQPLDSGHHPDLAYIKYIVANYISDRQQTATPIVAFLDRKFTSCTAAITGFRAGQIPTTDANDPYYPVVQWQEGREMEVMALFRIEEGNSFNTLLHYGEGITYQRDGRRWRRSTLEWQVSSLDHLGKLLTLAHQALGIHHWPEEELRRRLYEPEPVDNPEEQYALVEIFVPDVI